MVLIPGSDRRVIEASYESKCAYCSETIYEGDRIALLEDDGEWVHEECAEAADG